MLRENREDATGMIIPYAPGTLLQALAMYMPVSKFVTTELLSLSRTTNRSEHWVCWMSTGGKSSSIPLKLLEGKFGGGN